MNVPLEWLTDYVKLPKSVHELTDRLTMIGHMLDKTFEVEGNTVIDLELRGNRADLFGLIGIARDISAAWNTPLNLPEVATIPKKDSHSKLITVEVEDLVERFLAFTLTVKVESSPEWLVKRLDAYGMPSINNVVDITNYCMIETGEPMHAYDLNTLKGKRLIIRKAKDKETMKTLMGTTVSLTKDDLVIADEQTPQGLTMIGGEATRVTAQTTDIILEAAVYNQANVRRSARRLGIRTEAGNRHEKHLDPNTVLFALSRALYLLKKYANAKVTSESADFFPHPPKVKKISLPLTEIERLTGMSVDKQSQIQYLQLLGCDVQEEDKTLLVYVPSYRTDITESADLVEEIARLNGYEHIPSIPLSGQVPKDNTSPSIVQENTVRNTLVNLQLNEVITSSFVENSLLPAFSIHGEYKQPVVLQNAPDSSISMLRPTLIVNLLQYAKRAVDLRAERIALFEIGKVYSMNKTQEKTKKNKKQHIYHEERMAGIILTGTTDTKSFNRNPRQLEYADLKGIIESFGDLVGYTLTVQPSTTQTHPSLHPIIHADIRVNDVFVGVIGLLDETLLKQMGVNQSVMYAELSLDALLPISANNKEAYTIASSYPPVIEDMSFVIPEDLAVGVFIDEIKKIHPLISDVTLLDTYENKRTLNIVYQDATKNLTTDEIKPIRDQITKTVKQKFKVSLVGEE